MCIRDRCCVDGRGVIHRLGSRTTKGATGYDLMRLVVGSEGTLALIGDATLKLLPQPETVRTLADIVYVGNILAGTHFEWLYQDLDPDAGEAGIVRQKYADLLLEIETETREMQAIFA